jgi:hypothetical protein
MVDSKMPRREGDQDITTLGSNPNDAAKEGKNESTTFAATRVTNPDPGNADILSNDGAR